MQIPELEHFKISRKLSDKLCYSIFKARRVTDDKPVLLKILDASYNENDVIVSSFLFHARVLASVKHPNNYQVYECGSERDHNFIAMEPALPDSLSKLISQNNRSLTGQNKLRILSDLAAALRFMHLKGMVHCFLNPRDIHLDETSSLKIDNFGMSWFVPELVSRTDKKSRYYGKYVAPEMRKPEPEFDGRADVYSFGLIMHEMLTGELPASGRESGEVRELLLQKNVEGNATEILCKALRIKKQERYSNISELLEALGRVEYLKLNEPEPATVTEVVETGVATVEPAVIENPVKAEQNGVTEKEMVAAEAPPPEPVGSKPAGVEKTQRTRKGWLSILFIVLFVAISLLLFIWFTRDSGETRSEPDSDKSAAVAGPGSSGSQIAEVGASNDSTDNGQSLPDFQDQSKNNDLRATSSRTIQLRVMYENQPLRARVLLDNTGIGNTNAAGFVQINDVAEQESYALTVISDGYLNRTETVSFGAEEEVRTIQLARNENLWGNLHIRAVPAVDSVFIDGVYYAGGEPFEISLRNGQYSVKLVNIALRKSVQREMTVSNTSSAEIYHDFTEIETGKVAVSLTNSAQYGFAYVYVNGEVWPGQQKTTPIVVDLPVGSHFVSVNRPGFVCEPAHVEVMVEKDQTKYVAFTLAKQE